MSPVPSNYPPGVSGNEPEIVGYTDWDDGGWEPVEDSLWAHEMLEEPEPEEPDIDGPLRGECVTVEGYTDIAWKVVEHYAGHAVVAIMVGDDRRYTFTEDYVTVIPRESFCGECGQIGCGHDGLER